MNDNTPLTPEEEAAVRHPRGRSLVCSIDKHDRCNGYAPASAMTPCICSCHVPRQSDRWLATLDAARATPAKDTTALREAIAQAIYDAMRENDPEGRTKPWVPGGNSTKQDEARRCADAALATQPSPEPLDVDRLARALQSGVAWMDVLFPDEWPYVAAKVAAEYARLAAEKPEVDRG